MKTSIPGRAMLASIIAFLLLAAVLVWMHSVEQDGQPDEERVGAGSGEPGDEDPQSDSISPEEKEREREVDRRRAVRQLRSGSEAERRGAALRLQFIADETVEPELLALLRNPQEDSIVAARCEKALLNLWRHSRSLSAGRVFEQALADYDAGHYEAALQGFDVCEKSLQPAIPELYRLRAEIHLAQGRVDTAIDDARRALELKEDSFVAHCLLAECCLEKGDAPAALESVYRALQIYPGFERAIRLKAKIKSPQQPGGGP